MKHHREVLRSAKAALTVEDIGRNSCGVTGQLEVGNGNRVANGIVEVPDSSMKSIEKIAWLNEDFVFRIFRQRGGRNPARWSTGVQNEW